MGKLVQIKAEFFNVAMPDGRMYRPGQQLTLTNAEYAALSPALTRTITLLDGAVADPTRETTAPQSLADTLAVAKTYADAKTINGKTGHAVTLTREDTATPGYSALLPWYAALANRANKRVNVVHMGTSTVEGFPTTSWKQQQGAQLAALLRARHPVAGLTTGGRGFVGLQKSTGITWPVALTAGTNDTTHGYSAKFGTWYALAGTSSPKAILTLDAAVTSFDIHLLKGPNGGATNGYYKIDGGSAVTFTTVNAVVDLWANFHVASPATTSIEVGWNAAGWLFPGGIVEYAGDESKGIQVHNCGWGGSQASTWTGATASAVDKWPNAMALLTPDLIIMEFGANEHIHAVTPAQFGIDLTALIAMIRTAGMSCPIVLSIAYDVETNSFVYSNAWSEYVTAAKAVVAADPTMVAVDHTARMPVTTAASTYSLYHTDQIHGNANGNAYALMAETLYAAIAPR